MQTITVDKDEALAGTRVAMRRLCVVLRSVTAPNAPAVGTWTVRDVAAHLASGISLSAATARGEGSLIARLADIPDFNASGVVAFPDRDCRVLADRIEAALDAFVAAVAHRPGDLEVAWHAGVRLPLSSLCAVLLGEALIHGYDVARACNAPWPIDAAHARVVFKGLLPVLPFFVDSAAAAGVHATFDIRLRGGEDARVRFAFARGALQISAPHHGPVDCHISADPTAFVLVLYRRLGPLPPALTGKIVAWGRKPWLALRLMRLFLRP